MLEPDTTSRMYDAYLDAAMRGQIEEPEAFLLKRGVLNPALAGELQTIRQMALDKKLADKQEVEWLPGERLGGFRLLRQLGRGGMGIVYLAEQESLQRLVALKVIRPALQVEQEAVERLRREARTIARLRHPNIVTVYSFGQTHDILYFAMELIEGDSLRDLVKARPTPPKSQLLAWLAQIGRALHYAHGQGVLHRDVKTSNIMVEGGARPILLDFGLAREQGATPITRSFVGTQGYAASEQMRLLPLDARSDVFSLGVTLYRCLTGKLPFGSKPLKKVMVRLEKDAPIPPRQINPTVSPRLDAVVLRAIRRDREQRFASGLEFALAIEACLAEG